MQTASSPDWNPGDRPTLRITPAGIAALAYFDYVNVNHIVSLGPTDTATPEHFDDDRQPLPDVWNPRLTPWEDIPPADDPEDGDRDTEDPEYDSSPEIDWDDDSDYGSHSPEED